MPPKRLSLFPLKLEEVLSALLRTKPPKRSEPQSGPQPRGERFESPPDKAANMAGKPRHMIWPSG